MSTTTHTSTTGWTGSAYETACHRPLPAALDSLTIAGMIAEFEDFDCLGFLMPAGPEEDALWIKMLEVQLAARGLGLHSVRDLVLEQQQVFAVLTGVNEVTGIHDHRTSEDLHTYRNLVLALGISALGTVDGAASVCAWTDRLPPRRRASNRFLTNDEILLLRALALVEIEADPTSVAPLVYALLDAGLALEETIHFQLEDFHPAGDLSPDAQVLAWGSALFEADFISLDQFSTIGLFTDEGVVGV